MVRQAAIGELGTHVVTNQPPRLEDYDLFATDPVFTEVLGIFGNDAARDSAARYGHQLGRAENLDRAECANRNPPELKNFDRFGHRIDEVLYHPAYHELMSLATAHGQAAIAWDGSGAGHVGHSAIGYLTHQVEAGICCPLSMTYAGLPVLRQHPDLASEWVPKLLSRDYDPAYAPLPKKAGATIGMAMTEKQGGSDVRANTTRAELTAGDEYELLGHKWFCSAPMSDGFLTLAYAEGGQTCFFVPRWRPDGSRNQIFIQRLKDKLGNRSNASAEIEYHHAWARRIGEEGRGIATIMAMVHHTRLDCMYGAASLMRAALVQAFHHVRHRRAFQKKLIDQPLMRHVIADLALEAEAAVTLCFRVAQSFDRAQKDDGERAYSRLAVAISKYWLNKRAPNFIYEALECLGGAGYVEDGPMPRLYREGPLNSIWEGSGNVICLDVLRAIHREPEALEMVMDDIAYAVGDAPRLATHFDGIRDRLSEPSTLEARARNLVEDLAIALQASLLIRHAPAAVSDAFLASRLGGGHRGTYGTLPAGVDHDALLERVWGD